MKQRQPQRSLHGRGQVLVLWGLQAERGTEDKLCGRAPATARPGGGVEQARGLRCACIVDTGLCCGRPIVPGLHIDSAWCSCKAAAVGRARQGGERPGQPGTQPGRKLQQRGTACQPVPPVDSRRHTHRSCAPGATPCPAGQECNRASTAGSPGTWAAPHPAGPPSAAAARERAAARSPWPAAAAPATPPRPRPAAAKARHRGAACGKAGACVVAAGGGWRWVAAGERLARRPPAPATEQPASLQHLIRGGGRLAGGLGPSVVEEALHGPHRGRNGGDRYAQVAEHGKLQNPAGAHSPRGQGSRGNNWSLAPASGWKDNSECNGAVSLNPRAPARPLPPAAEHRQPCGRRPLSSLCSLVDVITLPCMHGARRMQCCRGTSLAALHLPRQRCPIAATFPRVRCPMPLAVTAPGSARCQ